MTDIENAWKSYEPQASKDGASQEIQEAMTSALSDLQAGKSAKDPTATRQASNNVSAAVVELFALYHPKVPADIGRLDMLERQVILDIIAKNYTAATASLAKTKSVWKKVKPSVLEHNDKNVAAEYETGLSTYSCYERRDFNHLLIRKKCGIINYQNLVLENPHEI